MRAAWEAPRQALPSEWAATSRIVSKDAAEKGPYSFDRAPHAREPIDCFGPQDPVQEIVLMWAARCSKTEVERRGIGYTIAIDPKPILIVFPDEVTAKRQVTREILPLIEEHPDLAQYQTGVSRDESNEIISLAHMNIYPAWAGSAQATADRTIGLVVLGEVDKYRDYAGRDAGAIDTAPRRTETYKHRRKVVYDSTPTLADGPISRLWKSCTDKRYWHVPCPECGASQRLVMSGLKWETRPGESKRQTADRVEAEQGARYECVACKARIPESANVRMQLAGRWVSDLPEGAPRPLRRGYHFNQISSLLGRGWSSIVAQFLRALASKAEGDRSPLMELTNQVLGEPYELTDADATIRDEQLAAKIAKGYPPRVVPKWAGLLIATVDTQRDGFWWVVRAWGAGERSRQIDRGFAPSLVDLERLTLNAPGYPVDGWPGEIMQIPQLYIDAGGGSSGEGGDRSLTDMVYMWCKSRPGRAQPLRGWGGSTAPTAPVQIKKIEHKPHGEARSPYDVSLMWVDTHYFKDVLSGLMQPAEKGADERWELCSGLEGDSEFALHMTSERKNIDRRTGAIAWMTLSGRPNHMRDAEVYQLAAARWLRVAGSLPDEKALELAREDRSRPTPTGDSESRDRDRWINPGKSWWKGNR